MEFVKIVLLSILAAITYGIIHDQITARICVEYFTIGHPPVFNTDSPTWLGLGWGVIATWWVGLFLGMPLALVAQSGNEPKLTAGRLLKPLVKLLVVMGWLAALAGTTCYVLLRRGILEMPSYVVEAIPKDHQTGFVVDLWTHSMSYLAGFVGGLVLIIWSWKWRRAAARRLAASAC